MIICSVSSAPTTNYPQNVKILQKVDELEYRISLSEHTTTLSENSEISQKSLMANKLLLDLIIGKGLVASLAFDGELTRCSSGGCGCGCISSFPAGISPRE